MDSKLDKEESEGSIRWPSRVCITAEGLPEWAEMPQGPQQLKVVTKAMCLQASTLSVFLLT